MFANVTVVADLQPAREVDPAQFSHLASPYLTSVNATTRAAAFYGSVGTFNPAALAFDEAHKDTVTTGELLTSTVSVVPAPRFRGDVLAINGDQDRIFCDLANSNVCGNIVLERQFYPIARSFESGGSCIRYAYP